MATLTVTDILRFLLLRKIRDLPLKIKPVSWIKSVPKLQTHLLETTYKLSFFMMAYGTVTGIRKYPWIFRELLDADVKFVAPKSIF